MAIVMMACSTQGPKSFSAIVVGRPEFMVSPSTFVVSPSHFGKMNGCFIIYDLKSDKIVKVYGEARCQERYPACSTFKVPLAVMGFDAQVLKDEITAFKWDGVKRPIDSWNQDHTAESWMKNSVVWYSQIITPKLGAKRFQKYLDMFDYGNRDISAGITSAWLTITKMESDKGRGSLKISAFEQLEFYKKFWRNQLPVKSDAIQKTKKISFLEKSPKGFVLHGKTGSGFLNPT